MEALLSFWYDRWFFGCSPKNTQLPLFNACISPWLILRQFYQQLSNPESLFHTATAIDLSLLPEVLPDCSHDQEDFFTWTLDKSVIFTIKSYYNFLIDDRSRSPLQSQFWKIRCPSKISLSCWISQDDKILTLSNFFKKGCNIEDFHRHMCSMP